jgi:hypothetical protein
MEVTELPASMRIPTQVTFTMKRPALLDCVRCIHSLAGAVMRTTMPNDKARLTRIACFIAAEVP